jgi:hypothetical protein
MGRIGLAVCLVAAALAFQACGDSGSDAATDTAAIDAVGDCSHFGYRFDPGSSGISCSDARLLLKMTELSPTEPTTVGTDSKTWDCSGSTQASLRCERGGRHFTVTRIGK